MQILIADDDRTIRIALKSLLSKWGYDVTCADDGAQAWSILSQPGAPRLAILDWMMPGMEGPALCKKIRESELGSYIYVILLTARDSKRDLLEGLDSGADDFIAKPFNPGELKARLKAAKRILSLEKELTIKNEELQRSNTHLARSNDIITKDLEVAASVQQSLLPTLHGKLDGYCFESLFMPCSIVGGDMFNVFQMGEGRLAFFILDISGHGVPAAMLSVTVSKTLTALLWEEALKSGESGEIHPERMAAKLNRLFQTSDRLPAYFTMILGFVDSQTGRAVMTQAGHPHPVLAPAQGELRLLGAGGFPIGLLEDAEYTREEFTLQSGDRLFLYSDGVTECLNPQEQEFSEKGLMRFLEENRSLALPELMRKTGERLHRHCGMDSFSDDISVMVLEKKPPRP